MPLERVLIAGTSYWDLTEWAQSLVMSSLWLVVVHEHAEVELPFLLGVRLEDLRFQNGGLPGDHFDLCVRLTRFERLLLFWYQVLYTVLSMNANLPAGL